ncbi:MAG: MarR family transcriptional regulator [Armatimonadetes bacterium]|nr:MarR family transcriptional regulator [Armatimonadota bacterium]
MNKQIELKDPQHEAWFLFLRAHARVIDRINKQVTEAGQIPTEWYDVLLSLDKAPDRRLRMSELADAVLLSRSGLTRLVDRLEKAGLLRREACPSDRRGSFAVLTDAGEAALRESWPGYARATVEHFARHLSDEEAETLKRILAKLLSANEEK